MRVSSTRSIMTIMEEKMTSQNAEVPVRTYGGFLKNNIREYGMLLSLVVIMGFFQYMTDGVLFKPLNLTNLILPEQLHRHHGAGHAAGDRGGAHRSLGGARCPASSARSRRC